MQRRLGFSQWHVSERAGGRLVGIVGLQPLDGGPEVELIVRPGAVLLGRRLRHGGGRGRARPRLRGGEPRARRRHREAAERGVGARAAQARHDLARRAGVLGQAVGSSTRSPRRTGCASAAGRRRRSTRTAWSCARSCRTTSTPCARVFGDPEVMRFVGERRVPLAPAEVRASQERREGALGGPRLRAAHRGRAGLGARARRGRTAAAGGRPGRRADVHARARRLGSRLRDRGRARRPAVGLRRACACRVSWRWPCRRTRPRCASWRSSA